MLKFGTDGVRGVANLDLTPELVLAFGRAAARVLGADRFVVGRDTRQSGPLLETALAAGLAAEGADVATIGVAPTPAVAWLAAADGVAGAVISASHNSYEDNGVKLFTSTGAKLSDAVEEALEGELHQLLGGGPPSAPPTGSGVGNIYDCSSEVERWTRSVLESVGPHALSGLHIVIDCANGAASAVAPDALRALGSEVHVLHDEPNGTNINAASGSTHPEVLQSTVVDRGADMGLAFDGDADRVLAVDGDGRLIDGDQIIAVTALDRRDRGLLARDTVVVTVMTNLGFRLGMEQHGVKVLEVPVGDRYVLEALASEGLSLGGEQSGHVVFADLATTGDGLLTAVQLLDVVKRSGDTLASLADRAMTRMPQVLRNVHVASKGLDVTSHVAPELAEVEASLGDTGRVLIRGSGTEALVRVMVEAPTIELAEHAAGVLVAAVERIGPS